MNDTEKPDSTVVLRAPAVYRSPKIEVRESQLQGRGIFAVERIAKEEIIAVKTGHVVTIEELAEITSVVGDLALQIDDYFYLTPKVPAEIETMSVFINHSCDPNVGFRGQVTYVSMREIEPEEELFHDYAMERSDNYYLKCKCGSSFCRAEVTGDDWKKPELQKRYGNYFSTYILKKLYNCKASDPQ